MSVKPEALRGQRGWHAALEHSEQFPSHILAPEEDDDGIWRGHMVCVDDGTSEPPGAPGFECGFDTRKIED